MIATDTAACSVVPPEPGDAFLTWHVAALRDLGLLVGELFDLDELAADCAADGVSEGFFVAAPMPDRRRERLAAQPDRDQVGTCPRSGRVNREAGSAFMLGRRTRRPQPS